MCWCWSDDNSLICLCSGVVQLNVGEVLAMPGRCVDELWRCAGDALANSCRSSDVQKVAE